MSDYQSPISPGRSWYEDSCGERPAYLELQSDVQCDVAIIGGGFCGLSAAYHLARAGTKVVLIDADRIGDGASGRNGGQMGSGQRAGVLELEKDLGFERSKALWDMAEDAKRSLLEIAETEEFTTDFQAGQLTPLHKQRFERDVHDEIEALQNRYNYHDASFLDRTQMSQALGSEHYFGGLRDTGTGHIHPLKYTIGLAKAATKAGAILHENTRATQLFHNGKISIATPKGTITAPRVLLALNGHHEDLHPALSRHVLPIQSFIGATLPLAENSSILPLREAVDDSRFVVRYFRKTADNRLLFGGREAYGKATPSDIRRAIGKQIAEIYPELSNIELTHAWGGNVAITLPRLPYVKELRSGLWTAGGFSGHGVMLSNYTGRMIADHWLGKSGQIKLLSDLDIRAFPGGTLLRNPLKMLALTWYAMMDRI